MLASMDRFPAQHPGEGLTPGSAELVALGRVALGVPPAEGDAAMLLAGHGLDTPEAQRTPYVRQEIPAALKVASAEDLLVSPVVRHTLEPPK